MYKIYRHLPRWTTLFLFFLVTTTSDEIGSPPKIVKEPLISELLIKIATHRNVNDEPFVIDCEAEGEPAPKYQWTKDGKDFDWQAHNDRIFQKPGHGTLNITKPRTEDIGKYQCFASNIWGTDKSNVVTVKTEMPTEKTVQEGNPFKLDCELPTIWSQPANIIWLTVNTEGRINTINNSRITADPEGRLWFSNVISNDTSNEFTYACAVASTSSQDSSSLRITNINLYNKINLTVTRNEDSNFQDERSIVQQYVTEKNKVVQKDEKVELFCIYGGNPLPKTVWLKDGTIVQPTERVSLRNYGKSLFIPRVKFEDRGNYTCNVSNGVGSSQSYNIELNINVIPYFKVIPKDVEAAVGETVVIECKVIGFPEPKIEWIYKGQPLNETSLDSRHVVNSNSITIMTATKNDTGIYGCNASNSVGHIHKDVYVNVLALAPNITDPLRDIDIVDDGRDVTIKCKHFGMPKPHIKWTRNNEELAGDRYLILDNGDLQIRGVDTTDSGNYTCNATNTYGTVNSTGKLTVKEHTKITAGPKDYEVIAGSTATFNCTAIADRSLRLKIEWLANGELVNFEDESSRLVKINNYSMAITKAAELDSGTYTCLASTELDNATANATLTVLDRPKPPELLGITCNKKDAAIKWQPKGDNHVSILYYTIEYNTSHAPNDWLIGSDNISASYQTDIVPMTPWANFTFRVVATNKIGRSDPSSQSDVCTTQTDVPYKNPDNVVAAGTEPSNLVISWTPMQKIEHNAPGFKYLVYWRPDVSGNEPWESEEVLNYTTNELVVTNQPTYQRYKVKVIAFNEKGESNGQQNEVIGYSGDDVPSDAPQNLTVLNITGNRSALLSWKPVSKESVQGNFTGYKILFWTEDEENNITVKVNSDKTTAEITNLLYNVKYYTCISAYNTHFDGPTSEVISFNTPEGAPGPVHEVTTKQWGTSSIFMSWKKPLETNGVLTGYRISYESDSEDELAEKIRYVNITDPHQTTVKLASLNPNTNYQICIQATTKVGAGEPVFITQQTKPPLLEGIELDKPEFNYEHVVNNNIFDTVRISWNPKLDGNPGSYFFVKYKLKGQNDYTTTESEHETNVTDVKDLIPGELYEFIIVAVDGNIKRESDAVQIEASSNADPRIRKSEHMATSGWFIAMLLALLFFVILLTVVCFVKRNKRGKYIVHESETTHGRHDYPDEPHFSEYSQPLGGIKNSESDADSAEFSEDDIGMTEDGSFIGLYCKPIFEETILTGQRNFSH